MGRGPTLVGAKPVPRLLSTAGKIWRVTETERERPRETQERDRGSRGETETEISMPTVVACFGEKGEGLQGRVFSSGSHPRWVE